MDREERKNVQAQQQRLVNKSPEQLKRGRPEDQQQTRYTQSENIDTVGGNSRPWSIAGIVIVGVLVATAAGVGSQLKMLTKGKTAPPVAPNPVVNNNNTPTAVSPQQEQEGKMLLGQAKLLANQGQPQQIAQAIAITQRLPTGVAVTPEANSLAATWSQKIMEDANTKAGAGNLTEAIAIAKLLPANTPQHQQAQQQIQQWQQRQAQASQDQFAATLAEASRPTPLPPLESVAPAPPVTTTPVAVKPTTAPKVTPEPVAQPQTAIESQADTATTAATKANSQTQTAQIKPPNNPGAQAQSLANDPYLNVKIPQGNASPVQTQGTTSTAIALNSTTPFTNNSYGFRNLVASAPTVAIQIRDNVDEDGDFVSLIVNGEVYTSNQMIFNHGKVFMVDLKPGENKVEIQGLKDGGGGITLEVNVAGVGNINETPIPEGSTASFIINREQ